MLQVATFPGHQCVAGGASLWQRVSIAKIAMEETPLVRGTLGAKETRKINKVKSPNNLLISFYT